MLPGMLMSDCNHPATAPIAQHHPYLLRIHDRVAVWRDVCDVSATPAMSGYAHGPSFSFGGE